MENEPTRYDRGQQRDRTPADEPRRHGTGDRGPGGQGRQPPRTGWDRPDGPGTAGRTGGPPAGDQPTQAGRSPGTGQSADTGRPPQTGTPPANGQPARAGGPPGQSGPPPGQSGPPSQGGSPPGAGRPGRQPGGDRPRYGGGTGYGGQGARPGSQDPGQAGRAGQGAGTTGQSAGPAGGPSGYGGGPQSPGREQVPQQRPVGRQGGRLLRPITAEDLVQREVVTVEPDTPVRTAVAAMSENDVGSVVVTDDRRAVGILTDRMVAMTLESEPDVADRKVEALMTGDLVTVTTDSNVDEVLSMLADAGIRRVPVVDDEQHLQGIVSLDDVIVLLASQFDRVGEVVEKQAPRF